MPQKEISDLEFVKKYCQVKQSDGSVKPMTLTRMDEEFLAFIDKAKKEGKNIMMIGKIGWRRR